MGRPKGSKNKPKINAAITKTVVNKNDPKPIKDKVIKDKSSSFNAVKIAKEDRVSWQVYMKFPTRTIKSQYGEGRSAAIALMCLNCVGCDFGYQDLIRSCTDLGCPLFKYRPYKDDRSNADFVPPLKTLQKKLESLEKEKPEDNPEDTSYDDLLNLL